MLLRHGAVLVWNLHVSRCRRSANKREGRQRNATVMQAVDAEVACAHAADAGAEVFAAAGGVDLYLRRQVIG